jgi:RNase P subunit RPR2
VMTQHRDIFCRNCGHAIHLQSSMRRKAPWLLLACSSCGHVYEYELQPYLVGSRKKPDSPSLILRSIACECSDSDCRFPVAVHIVLPAGTYDRAELAKHREQWIFHGATCPFGHPLGSQERGDIA